MLAENKYAENITSKLHNIIVEQQKLSETIFKNSITTHASEQSAQLGFSCSKLPIETLEQDVKYVQS